MNEIRLLILDDDKEIIKSFQQTISRINRDNEQNFTYKEYIANTLKEAKEIIKYNKLDTAVIDLNLNNAYGADPDNADGNIAIEELMTNFRMPIFVVSGEPAKLQEKLKDNYLIKVYPRDQFVDGFENIIPSLFLSESIHYFARDGFLEQKINKFYWEHLSLTIKSWEKVGQDYPGDIKKILSRHTLSCLNEQLYVNGNIGSFDKYHFGEMYIIPPIKQHYHTGDIIEKDDEKFIVINPACDIVNKGKMEYYALIKIYKAVNISKIKTQNTEKQESYINENLKDSNKLGRYHFLPKFDLFDENYVIDFQNITIIKIGEGEKTNDAEYLVEREKHIKEYKRIASISSPFLKDIIARFSAYYARQGQPNFL